MVHPQALCFAFARLVDTFHPFFVHQPDDIVNNKFEGIAATLKAAKKRGVLNYASPLLLQGAHDNVDIVMAEDK